MKNYIGYEYRPISLEPYGSTDPNFNGIRLGHIAIHNSLNANAGDTLLPQAVRKAFDSVEGQFAWTMLQVWEPFNSETVDFINSKLDALIIGGGGFFIRDQAGGNIANSGWLWNIPSELIERITVPLIFFAVGYNRFRRQPDFPAHFAQHLEQCVRRSPFFGLRNTGSIKKVSSYLKDEKLKSRFRLQFCPTTASKQLFPSIDRVAQAYAKTGRAQPRLAFNFAYDRPEMRFGDREQKVRDSCVRALKVAADDGWEIVLVSHKDIDRELEKDLLALGLEFESHNLTGASYLQILDFYANIDLAVGMRGHSQLIPIGIGKPIFSIISHDKMRYFLDDTALPSWGADVESPNFEEELIAGMRHHKNNLHESYDVAADVQQKLWLSTQSNVHTIKKLIVT